MLHVYRRRRSELQLPITTCSTLLGTEHRSGSSSSAATITTLTKPFQVVLQTIPGSSPYRSRQLTKPFQVAHHTIPDSSPNHSRQLIKLGGLTSLANSLTIPGISQNHIKKLTKPHRQLTKPTLRKMLRSSLTISGSLQSLTKKLTKQYKVARQTNPQKNYQTIPGILPGRLSHHP